MDYGFEMGGPIVKDKAWFWGSASKMDLKQKDLAGNPARTTIKSYAFKSAWQATPAIRPSFTFFRSSGGPRALGLSPARPPETALIIDAPISLYKVQSDSCRRRPVPQARRSSSTPARTTRPPAASTRTWCSTRAACGRAPPSTAPRSGRRAGGRRRSWFKATRVQVRLLVSKQPITSSSKIVSDGQKVWTSASAASPGRRHARPGERDWKSDTTGHFGSAWVGDTLVFDRATVNLALRFDREHRLDQRGHRPAVPTSRCCPRHAPGIDAALKYSTLSRASASRTRSTRTAGLWWRQLRHALEPAQDPRRRASRASPTRASTTSRSTPTTTGWRSVRSSRRAHRLLRLDPSKPGPPPRASTESTPT